MTAVVLFAVFVTSRKPTVVTAGAAEVSGVVVDRGGAGAVAFVGVDAVERGVGGVGRAAEGRAGGHGILHRAGDGERQGLAEGQVDRACGGGRRRLRR
jgi:hypothetical protein